MKTQLESLSLEEVCRIWHNTYEAFLITRNENLRPALEEIWQEFLTRKKAGRA